MMPAPNIMWSGTLAHNGIRRVTTREDWSSNFMEHEVSALYPEVAHGAGLAVIVPMDDLWHNAIRAKVAQPARRALRCDCRRCMTAAMEGIEPLREFSTSLGLPHASESLE